MLTIFGVTLLNCSLSYVLVKDISRSTHNAVCFASIFAAMLILVLSLF